MRRKSNDRIPEGERFTILRKGLVNTDAWRALSTTAQALYPILRMEWRGHQQNNNGSLSLSSRQAAAIMGVKKAETITSAFTDLQAKGFVVVTKPACLGVEGRGKSFEFELTELALPGFNKGRELYKDWKPGDNFPIVRGSANNPDGANGKIKPCPENRDGPVLKTVTK